MGDKRVGTLVGRSALAVTQLMALTSALSASFTIVFPDLLNRIELVSFATLVALLGVGLALSFALSRIRPKTIFTLADITDPELRKLFDQATQDIVWFRRELEVVPAGRTEDNR